MEITHKIKENLPLIQAGLLLLAILSLIVVVVFLAKNYDTLTQDPIQSLLQDNNIDYMSCSFPDGTQTIFINENSEVKEDWTVGDFEIIGKGP